MEYLDLVILLLGYIVIVSLNLHIDLNHYPLHDLQDKIFLLLNFQEYQSSLLNVM